MRIESSACCLLCVFLPKEGKGSLEVQGLLFLLTNGILIAEVTLIYELLTPREEAVHPLFLILTVPFSCLSPLSLSLSLSLSRSPCLSVCLSAYLCLSLSTC